MAEGQVATWCTRLQVAEQPYQHCLEGLCSKAQKKGREEGDGGKRNRQTSTRGEMKVIC